jgi:hypothetical protein
VSSRLFGSMPIIVVTIAVWSLVPGSGAGQAPAAAQAPAAKAGAYTPPRTPDGQPDLQGMWNPNGFGPVEAPFEAPAGGGGGGRGRGQAQAPANQANTPAEAPAAGAAPAAAAGAPVAANAPAAGGRGGRGRGDQRPMVVDPPDGKIPLQPWAWERREEIMRNQAKLEYLDPRVKCLPAGVPRANMPIQFNTYQFLQVPGYVILLYEWNHLYRVVPLDGRPHANPNIRLWMGDSRGHWEGNTLVVDVTNFNDQNWLNGIMNPPEGVSSKTYTNGSGVFNSEALHVVERFTLKDADTISYEATIEDPKVFTRPWKIALDAFKRAPKDHMLYEYACFEGDFRHISLLTGIDMTKDAK